MSGWESIGVLLVFANIVLADEIKGTLIVYENLNDRFSADGSSTVTGVGSGRVSATIAPKPAAQRGAVKAESTPK